MKRSTIGRVAMFFGLALAIGFAGVSCIGAGSNSQRDVAQMADRADQFLMSLSDEERARTTFGFESDERKRFHFVPPEVFERHGLPLREMSTEQKDRAHDLLRTGLSQSGYMTATEIIELEAVLEALAGGEQFSRDPELYFVAVFGTPSTDGTWAWRFEGTTCRCTSRSSTGGSPSARRPSWPRALQRSWKDPGQGCAHWISWRTRAEPCSHPWTRRSGPSQSSKRSHRQTW